MRVMPASVLVRPIVYAGALWACCLTPESHESGALRAREITSKVSGEDVEKLWPIDCAHFRGVLIIGQAGRRLDKTCHLGVETQDKAIALLRLQPCEMEGELTGRQRKVTDGAYPGERLKVGRHRCKTRWNPDCHG